MTRLPRKLVIAGVTAATMISVTSRILPSSHTTDTGAQQASRGYIEGQKQEEATRRLTRNTVQDAINSDELAAREARQAANDAVRNLLRDP